MERLAVDRRTEPLGDQRVHFARLRVPFEARLREQDVTVERDFEATAHAWDQRRPNDSRRPSRQQLSRQTGGSIRVASGDAVLDFEHVSRVRRFGGHGQSLLSIT